MGVLHQIQVRGAVPWTEVYSLPTAYRKIFSIAFLLPFKRLLQGGIEFQHRVLSAAAEQDGEFIAVHPVCGGIGGSRD